MILRHYLSSLVELKTVGEVNVVSQGNVFSSARDLDGSCVKTHTSNDGTVGRIPSSFWVIDLHNLLGRVCRVRYKFEVAVTTRFVARLRIGPLMHSKLRLPRVCVLAVKAGKRPVFACASSSSSLCCHKRTDGCSKRSREVHDSV